MHGQSEHEEEGGCQGCQAGPRGDPQCVGREMMAEDGNEDGAEDSDSERARQLLHGLEDPGGGTDLVHAHAVQDELEQLPDGGADARTDEEQAGDEVPA